MKNIDITQCGDELFDCMVKRRTVAPLTERFDGITVEDAYHISLRMLSRRIEAGERVIGKKIGVTSEAVQEMLGVFQPDPGLRSTIVKELLSAGLEVGGEISAEHGVGAAKKDYFLELEDPAKVGLLRRIKHAFDPKGILNPGTLYD